MPGFITRGQQGVGAFGAGAALLAAGLLTGCNSLTGASSLVEEGGGGAESILRKAETTASASSGNAAAATGSTGEGTGSGSTSTGVAPGCVYPKTGYGVMKGDTVRSGLTWQAYGAGAAQIETINIEDFYDCNGSLGIDAILLDSSATWCGSCQQEAADFDKDQVTWKAEGIVVITLMVQDLDPNTPATPTTALNWRNQFHLTDMIVAADPAFSFSFPGTIGLPLQVLVDPRTMKIVGTQQGYSGDYSALLALAQQNKAP
jgi:thiol-disulfide isomerase/thioredoxin